MGLVRQNNEDVWASLPKYGIYVIADGMGGHQAGEVASREAVYFFLSYIQNQLEKKEGAGVEAAREMMWAALMATNRFIFELAHSHELLRGMGTTFCALHFYEEWVVYGHVGDSRIYRLRERMLQQLTKDHSLIAELMDRGETGEQRMREGKSVITRAIGTEDSVQPDVKVAQAFVGDQYLLCTDGLTDMLSPKEIEYILLEPLTVEERVRSLIVQAKKRGGYDNITAVLIHLHHATNKKYLS